MLRKIERAIQDAIQDGVLPEQFEELDAYEQVQAMITAIANINRETSQITSDPFRSWNELETAAYRWHKMES